jgi:hypothetical protein
MVETWTSMTLAGIGYYGRNLDISNFGRNWANYGHKTSLGFFFFFFEQVNWLGGICWERKKWQCDMSS